MYLYNGARLKEVRNFDQYLCLTPFTRVLRWLQLFQAACPNESDRRCHEHSTSMVIKIALVHGTDTTSYFLFSPVFRD